MTAGPTHRMPAETAATNGSVIYIVDDDKAVRVALGSLMRSVGLRVEVFESPDEFLRFPHSAGPSCLILDVRLRGKSGMAFLRISAMVISRFGERDQYGSWCCAVREL
jgi:ActR/RegA family two-component response regulator